MRKELNVCTNTIYLHIRTEKGKEWVRSLRSKEKAHQIELENQDGADNDYRNLGETLIPSICVLCSYR